MSIVKPSWQPSGSNWGQQPLTPKGKVVTVVVIVAVIGCLIFGLKFLNLLYEPFLYGLVLVFIGIRNIPWAVVEVNLVEPVLVGAAAGLIIGWMRRGLAVRRRSHETLVSSLVSSRFWQGNPGHAILLFFVNGVSGFLIGLIFSSAGIFISWEDISASQYYMDKVGFILTVIGGGGAGGGSFEDLRLFLTLLVLAIIVAIIVILLLNRILAYSIIKSALQGGVSGATKQLVSACFEEWGLQTTSERKEILRGAFRNGIFQGIVTGSFAGTILSIMKMLNIWTAI